MLLLLTASMATDYARRPLLSIAVLSGVLLVVQAVEMGFLLSQSASHSGSESGSATVFLNTVEPFKHGRTVVTRCLCAVCGASGGRV